MADKPAASVASVASAEAAVAREAATKAHAKCEAMKDRAVQTARVAFMLDALRAYGCPVGDNPERTFISCAKLGTDKAGGFQTQPGQQPHIYLGEDVGYGPKQVEQTLTHELVHAFDQCRAKVRWDNLLHHACTEIRASALSGECDLMEEVNRGNLSNFAGQQTACVKRRAELSVAMNPHCDSKAKAAEAVKAAFERCYYDTSPFMRMP